MPTLTPAQILEPLALAWACGATLTIVLFLVAVVIDRCWNGTPWNAFTISSRIPLLFILWPLFLVLGCVFLLPGFVRRMWSRNTSDTP